jgi:hypothetical protein
VGGVGVVKRDGLLLKIKHIYGATSGLELLSDVTNDVARHGFSLHAANHGQDT